MYLWLLMVVGAFVDGSATHWEPCKGQCINNYKENDIVQESLTSACQKGCDLLTAAFISTSEQIPFQHEPKVKSTKQKRSTTLILHLFGNRPNAHLRLTNEVPPNNPQTKIDSPISVTSNKPPSIADKDGIKQVDRLTKNELFKIDKQESSSKTTMEPTSQPVQDHPVEANRQTTTTNGPRGETKPTSHKERKENLETKIKNAKHAQKHSSAFKHNTGKKNDIKKNKDNKMSKNIYSIKNKHETTKNEHLNMKERLEQAKHTCRQECIVTYTKAAEQEACVVGCNLQLTTLSLNDPEEDLKEEEEPQPKVASWNVSTRNF
ncbi:hypothetical protein Anas_04484 [Armadillidium nasatum]|uniref:Uncharacterized protein n=1 Tax=Armadillidium nasatum TaxID=96803 RepID=A0A5N5TH76_9CRUS|nr:hypothetical protein Anas_04484 [Armadillidium nasatum]